MVQGFLKGIWGKPATQGTGLMGIWGTITKAPKTIFGAITTPFKIFKYMAITVVAILIYVRFKK